MYLNNWIQSIYKSNYFPRKLKTEQLLQNKAMKPHIKLHIN